MSQGKVETIISNGIATVSFFHPQSNSLPSKIIEALAKGYERGQTENHIDLLLKLQSAIEVLDTLADEEEDEDDDDDSSSSQAVLDNFVVQSDRT